MQRLSRLLAGTVVVVGLAWFCWGAVSFPDGPIARCGTSYCGKQSQPHTQSDYERFHTWEAGLLFGWPLVMLGGWWLSRRR